MSFVPSEKPDARSSANSEMGQMMEHGVLKNREVLKVIVKSWRKC